MNDFSPFRNAPPPFTRGEVRSISRQRFHKIAYTEWGDPKSARVVMCVHGLSRQGRDFDVLAATLAELGYRVICPDLAGRGLSGRLANPDDYALPQYAIDMTMLIARLGVETVDWVGTSLGGLTGMVLAGMPESPISRLVINDIGPFLPWKALRRLGDSLRMSPTVFENLEVLEMHLRGVLKPFGMLSDKAWRHIAEHSASRRADGQYELHYDRSIAEAFRPGRIYNMSLWPYWDAIRCPVLVLRGEMSDLLEPRTAAEMAKRGPCATIVEIPGCGHAPSLMDASQTRIITDWLSGAAVAPREHRPAASV